MVGNHRGLRAATRSSSRTAASTTTTYFDGVHYVTKVESRHARPPPV